MNENRQTRISRIGDDYVVTVRYESGWEYSVQVDRSEIAALVGDAIGELAR